MDWHEEDNTVVVQTMKKGDNAQPPSRVLELRPSVPTRWSSFCYMIQRCAAVTVVWDPFDVGCSCLFGIASVFESSYFAFQIATLRPYVDEYSRQYVEHLEALGLSDCDALKVVYEVLGLARETTERLEGEHIPIGWCALKYLWRFVCIMDQRSPSDSVAVLNAQQCITVPLGRAMGDKMFAELDDPNWVFAMAFMAYMDPSGEYFAVDTRSM